MQKYRDFDDFYDKKKKQSPLATIGTRSINASIIRADIRTIYETTTAETKESDYEALTRLEYIDLYSDLLSKIHMCAFKMHTTGFHETSEIIFAAICNKIINSTYNVSMSLNEAKNFYYDMLDEWMIIKGKFNECSSIYQ